jgi:hypothetical protein
MRLPLIPPRQLSPAQRTLYDDMHSTLVAGGPPTSRSRRAVPTTSPTRSSRGGVLPEPCYALAVKLFGQHAPTS